MLREYRQQRLEPYHEWMTEPSSQPFDLASLWSQAQDTGWVAFVADEYTLRSAVSRTGWISCPGRDGQEIERIKPFSEREAYPRSISATHGLSEQPLHIDGSHLRTPPDVLILTALLPSNIPTKLLRINPGPGHQGRPPLPRASLESGVFTVETGRDSFLASVVEPEHKTLYRYDSNVMKPADHRARKVAEFFLELQGLAEVFVWDRPNLNLLIDNRVSLHGRADASMESGEKRELLRASYFAERDK